LSPDAGLFPLCGCPVYGLCFAALHAAREGP
jgi:hypothetical protein